MVFVLEDRPPGWSVLKMLHRGFLFAAFVYGFVWCPSGGSIHSVAVVPLGWQHMRFAVCVGLEYICMGLVCTGALVGWQQDSVVWRELAPLGLLRLSGTPGHALQPPGATERPPTLWSAHE
jgi:hypothetical protein